MRHDCDKLSALAGRPRETVAAATPHCVAVWVADNIVRKSRREARPYIKETGIRETIRPEHDVRLWRIYPTPAERQVRHRAKSKLVAKAAGT
jgi:hypothetical protein